MTWTIAAVVLPWLVVLFGVGLAVRLLRQSGAVMLRIASVENYLDWMDDAIRELMPQPRPDGLSVGSPAPPFELPDLDGRRISLEQFRGRRVLLIFFSPDCGFCRTMAPSLTGLEAGEGAPLPLLITTGELDANRALLGEHGIRFPALLQQEGEVSSAYSAAGTPMAYLVDEGGRIASPLVSGADDVLRLAQLPSRAGNGNGAGAHGADPSPEAMLPRRVGWQKQTGLRPGVRAPYFLLPRLGGGRLSLKEYRGRRVLLVFSSPDCPACDRVMPVLEGLYGRSSAFQMVVISRGEQDENRAKASKLGLTAPVGLQRANEISRLYRKFETPAAYVINEEGILESEASVGGEILQLAAQAALPRAGQAAAPMTWRGSDLTSGGS
jgi:peroxiredoxin